MNKTNLLNIFSVCAMMVATLPAFAYVYLLFNHDYYVYDFVLDDDTLSFCAIFVGLSFVSRILAFWGEKKMICDFSIAMFLLIFGWIMIISGLGRAFDIYLFQSGFYTSDFGYTGEFIGIICLGVGAICLAIGLVYFSKFYKALNEIYKSKAIFSAGILWIIGAIIPIFGGVILFISSLVEFFYHKRVKIAS